MCLHYFTWKCFIIVFISKGKTGKSAHLDFLKLELLHEILVCHSQNLTPLYPSQPRWRRGTQHHRNLSMSKGGKGKCWVLYVLYKTKSRNVVVLHKWNSNPLPGGPSAALNHIYQHRDLRHNQEHSSSVYQSPKPEECSWGPSLFPPSSWA